MSIESEAGRLDIVRTLAGIERDDVYVRHPGGQFAAWFDNPSLDTSFDVVDIEGTAPMLGAMTSDVENLKKDTPLTFRDFRGRDVTYKLDKHEPDGTGMSRVLLSAS